MITSRSLRSAAELVVIVAAALFFAFAIQAFAVKPYLIPSDSMLPTLEVGQRLLVDRFSHRVGADPKIGDVTVFMPPAGASRDDRQCAIDGEGPSYDGGPLVGRSCSRETPGAGPQAFVKRVVGVPGDVIETRDKVLYVNGKPATREPMPEPQQREILDGGVLKDPQYTVSNPEFFIERLPRGENETRDHMLVIDKNAGMGRSFGPITVPADSLFCMGDNRDVSNDSRFWGFVPVKNVAGRATAIWFSFWVVNLSEGQFYFHPSRIGTGIH